ncbi:N-acetylglucosamine-1-phosphodiester alpha-N-acetylglucosaminidase-like isoform X2 [Salvelinus alpinus]|uniref:N-acetylglucosamine-1-phosphodiester alpha-N-acetylglucosaminidase-like isoform X2 n=1 Tax=Salvelinus alpinus TaxID=8036 RepID=UPI0039FDD130
MTLWEVADFLKGQGVINAINLDGDGSSTYMANGSLASYPSDHCVSDPMWCCPRRVSTILCVHQPQCQPEDCSGHGMGTANGWSGTGCDTLVCQPPACGAHGVCTQDGCACDAGWRGENCSQEYPLGLYGLDCGQECQCKDMCPCDPVTGSCNALFQGEKNHRIHGTTRNTRACFEH